MKKQISLFLALFFVVLPLGADPEEPADDRNSTRIIRHFVGNEMVQVSIEDNCVYVYFKEDVGFAMCSIVNKETQENWMVVVNSDLGECQISDIDEPGEYSVSVVADGVAKSVDVKVE